MTFSGLTGYLTLCVIARLALAFNDIFTGRLARTCSATEVVMWRGLGLGVWMAPLLGLVPASAWHQLPLYYWPLLRATLFAVLSLVCEMRAAKLMPFGVRGVFMMGSGALGGLAVGILYFHEALGMGTLFFCALLTAASIVLSLGDHSTHELENPKIMRGILLSLACGGWISLAMADMTVLLRATHPLLAGWAWEFLIGIFCLPLLLVDWPVASAWNWWQRGWRIAVAGSPTVIGTGASFWAVSFGPMSISSVFSGLQAAFIAMLGAYWHREKIGPVRWLLIALTVLSIAGIGWTMRASSGN